MHFELWTVPTGNIVDDFVSEDEAPALVRELIAGTTPQAADALLLTLVHDDGTGGVGKTRVALQIHPPHRICGRRGSRSIPRLPHLTRW